MPHLPITALLLAFTLATADAAEPDRATIEKFASLLTSQSASERTTGQQWLEAHGESAIASLVADLEKAPETYAVTANLLRNLISPFARAESAYRIHKGHLNLYLPTQNVTRPTDHPQAPEIRKAALRTLEKILAAPDPELRYGIRTLAQLLVEVADQPTVDTIVAHLEKRETHEEIVALTYAAQTIYGIPTYNDWGGICGNSSEEEIARFAADQLAAAKEARKTFLTYHEAHRKDTPAERTASAVAQWLPAIPKYAGSQVADWLVQSYTPLIRLGPDAIPALRAAQSKAGSPADKAPFEIIIAAISGEADKALIKSLLDIENSPEKNLALEIINASGSTGWKSQLDALQDPKSEVALKASHVLANLHRSDALPQLKAAANKDPDNYLAKCAVDEILAWGE